MPNTEGKRPMAPGGAAPAAALGLAAGAAQSFPRSGASAAVGPRRKPSSVAFPRAQAFPTLKHAFMAPPEAVNRQRPRDVAVENWRERAGPWFEPSEYEKMMQESLGSEFRFRSDEYESDSEGSDYDDIPVSEAAALDPAARAERFQRDTAALLDRYEDILSEHRQASFTQNDFLKGVAPDSSGVCLALSVGWLQAAHADPQQPAAERIDTLTSGQEAKDVLEVQQQSDTLHMELPYRSYYPLKELSEKSTHLSDVRFSKYINCKAGPGETLSDVGAQAALRLQHDAASRYHVLIPTPGAHAIACEKLDDGRFRLFEPNHGAYEVEPGKLNELLAGVLASHMKLVKAHEDRYYKDGIAITKLIPQLELRIVPVHMAPADAGGDAGPAAASTAG